MMRNRVLLAIAVSIGLALTLTLYGILRERELTTESAEFQNRASVNGQAVHRAIRYTLEVMQSFRSVASVNHDEPEKMRAFATETLRRHTTMSALEFSPRTSAAGSARFPLRLFASLDSTAIPGGVDLAADTVRRVAMERARDLDSPVATPLTRLAEIAGKSGWVIVLPVFTPGPPPLDSPARRARLVGYVHGVIHGQTLAATCLRTYNLDDMVISLEKGHAPGVLLEVARIADAGSGTVLSDTRLFRWEGGFTAAETSWRIIVEAREGFVEKRHEYYPLIVFVLVAGFLGTTIFGFYFARRLEADQKMREDNERYVRELAARDAKMRDELALARVIQKELLPKELPVMNGLEIGLSFVPSGEIGGDYFDFIPDPGRGRLDVVFADLSGHGVPAALLFAIFRTLARNAFRAGHPPAATLIALNRQLTKIFPKGRFASTFFTRIDMGNESLSYVKASQESGIVLGEDGTVTMLDQGDVLLGAFNPDIFGDPEYREIEIRLRRGDVIFLFTDGIVEVEDSEGRQLGVDGLLKWLSEERGCAAQLLVDRLYARTVEYAGTSELKDDFTVMAIRMTGE